MFVVYLSSCISGLLGEKGPTNTHKAHSLETELLITLFFAVDEKFPIKEFAFNELFDPNRLQTNANQTVVYKLLRHVMSLNRPHRTLCSLSWGKREDISLADSLQKGHPNLRRKMMTQV